MTHSTSTNPAAAVAARRLKITGHRGARGIAPENTLAGFQLAMDLGVDMIELDVHLTRDGELAVMHDPHVERTTDGTGTIESYTLAELKQLNAAARFSPPAGYTGRHDYGVQRVPTLQEVYDLVGGRCRINVEIKLRADGGRYPGLEERLVAMLRHNHAIEHTVIASFDPPSLAAVRALEPRLTWHGIVSRPFFEALAARGAGAQQAVDEWVGRGVYWMAVNQLALSAELIGCMKRAGITAHAWIVDDLESLVRLAEMGVDHVTSDRPDVLLAARG